MDEKYSYSYINFIIKKYNSIEHIIQIIRLLDEKMCGEEKFHETNTTFKISRSFNTYYDYICVINKHCDNTFIMGYLDYKFKQIVNLIKFDNRIYGLDWYVEYTLELI